MVVVLALGAGLWPRARLKAVERRKAELKPRFSAMTSRVRWVGPRRRRARSRRRWRR